MRNPQSRFWETVPHLLQCTSGTLRLRNHARRIQTLNRSICPETGRLRWRDSAYPILRL